MSNILRILALAVLTVLCGMSIYGIIYSPRLFKVLAFIVLTLCVLIVYGMVKQWLGGGKKKKNTFTEAEIIDDEQ